MNVMSNKYLLKKDIGGQMSLVRQLTSTSVLLDFRRQFNIYFVKLILLYPICYHYHYYFT
jgi:hypothetical protein